MTKEAKIEYPQNFDIKLVVAASYPQYDTKQAISRILSECKVVHNFVNVRASTKGNYLSYAYNIDIESKEQLDQTYQALTQVPGLKFAL